MNRVANCSWQLAASSFASTFYIPLLVQLKIKSTWLTQSHYSFNVKGKSAHDGPISGSVSTTIVKKNLRISHVNGKGKIEGKYSDKATGTLFSLPFPVVN